MTVLKSAKCLELKTSKHLCGCIICLVACPKKIDSVICLYLNAHLECKLFHPFQNSCPTTQNPSLSIWNGFSCMACSIPLPFKRCFGTSALCWGLMEYKTCEHCILLSLGFSFFVLFLKTSNSPNQTRQTGVRVWAEHFLAVIYFWHEKAADCLQIQRMSTPSLVHSASGRVGQCT